MAKNGFKIMDSDMHVFEPHDLYLKYMNPKWGAGITRGEPREGRLSAGLEKHGMVRYVLGEGGLK